jgi:hypothetical protein
MYALSWYRTPFWADKLGKPEGRAVSNYLSTSYVDTLNAAEHINSIAPEFDCEVEVFK